MGMRKVPQQSVPAWMPSPKQVREACLQIQADWTETERISRRVGNAGVYGMAIHAVQVRCRRKSKPLGD